MCCCSSQNNYSGFRIDGTYRHIPKKMFFFFFFFFFCDMEVHINHLLGIAPSTLKPL